MAYLFYHSWLGGGAEAKNRKKNDAATVNSLSHVLFVGLWLWTAAINNTHTTVRSQRLPPHT